MFRLAWLGALVKAMTAPPAQTSTAARRLTSIDMGHCPGCGELRAASSPSCWQCNSTAAVTADA
jgi:hypothetical protein